MPDYGGTALSSDCVTGKTLNPLIPLALDVLQHRLEPVSEYEFIRLLENSGFEFPQADSSELSLFRRHFLLMNALYQIQQDIFEEGYYLNISALDIRLEPVSTSGNASELISDADIKLREYYLDWTHYAGTTQQEVEHLLTGFWHRYYSLDKRDVALDTLGLDAAASDKDIKAAYRRLVAQHHPDKGGNPVEFIEIRRAYEILITTSC